MSDFDELEEEIYYDEILGRPPDEPPSIKAWIGRDKAVVEVVRDKPLHWSEKEAMGYKAPKVDYGEYGDNDPRDPEQNLEMEEI